MPATNPFLRKEDFQSLVLTLKGENATSHTPIEGDLEISELTEDGFWIQVPYKSCQRGHMLMLNVDARRTPRSETPGAEEVKFNVTAMVEELGESLEQGMLVRLVFRQYAKDQWQALLDYFAKRQGDVNELVRRTRE